MNDMEQHLVDKTLEAVHQLELKVVALQGEIKALREHGDEQHNTLTEKIDQHSATDTKRLDTHSTEIDNHSERLATMEEWKKQFEESVRNRMVVSQSITTIAAVVIAYLLSKFL